MNLKCNNCKTLILGNTNLELTPDFGQLSNHWRFDCMSFIVGTTHLFSLRMVNRYDNNMRTKSQCVKSLFF